MSYGNFLKAFKEFGPVGTFWKLFQMRTLKFGTLMGVDQMGNKYYENTEYPYPQHRWVEYAGNPAFYDSDPSNIPAEWHGWLHNTTNDVPTDTTTGSTHKEAPPTIMHGNDDIYDRNLGGVIAKHTPNFSHHRPRGYGLGNGLGSTITSPPGVERYYTQPGHPMDDREQPTRRIRHWSLRDTEASLAAAEQAKLDGAAASQLEEGSAGTFAGGAAEIFSAEEEAWIAANGHVPGDVDSLEGAVEKMETLQNVISELKTGAPSVVREPLEIANEQLEVVAKEVEMMTAVNAKWNARV